ncbi:uncharacterized protein NMK_2479 [Novimethylophilus kurashikiensis]|uniref:Uncharacterized protein n=1 Tax=Novimethylophilus kurashikiensis TaxID=1825523 RepID=A0A2R5FBG0_9PROT|nr:hypothetical protein [Novimethylophilus kurashikiensis]GBG14878.1 uncharacterized protein NMK_2479 [Novimethylophilus kurashikiensis]
MQITETKTVTETKEIYVAPCLKCGSADIKLWDCGYTEGNVGGGVCKECGHEGKQGWIGSSPSKEQLAGIWNAANDIDTLITAENTKIEASRRTITELESLRRERADAAARKGNLGAKLQHVQRLKEEGAALAEKANDAAQEAVELQRATEVEAFFESFKLSVTLSIERGELPKPYALEEGEAYQHLGAWDSGMVAKLNTGQSKYSPQWKALIDWGAGNGLKVDCLYTWDGGGTRSWHVLTVKPMP